MRTGQIITIDPSDTIPLACVREISSSGVAKLERAFRTGDESGMSTGASSAAPLPIVVNIPNEHLHVVVAYFVSKKGLSEENATAISVSKIWFGIVEGAHRRKALINLASKVPEQFKGYPWVVICIQWQPFHIIRGLARERNELMRGENIVDFTMYDVFKGLKLSANVVALREGTACKGYRKRVADHYCGGKDIASGLTCQLAGIAVVLSWPVIEEMGVLLNSEVPDLAKQIARSSSNQLIDEDDARIRRNLQTRSTFRGATTFKTVASERDQISTLRRMGFVARQRNYKSFSKANLEMQTKKAIAARKEVAKVEEKLWGHTWPEDMDSIRQALLTTTTFDAEVEENNASDGLLPEFQELWEKLFPIAAEHEVASKVSQRSQVSPQADEPENVATSVQSLPTADDTSSSLNFNPSVEDILPTSDIDGGQDNEREGISETNGVSQDSSVDVTSDEVHIAENASLSDTNCDVEASYDDAKNELCPLKQLSLRAENKTWKEFERTLVAEDLFDFIIADPQQSLTASELKEGVWTEFKDLKRMKEFANFCRIALRPACYCFIFILADEFSAWASALQEHGMSVMKKPFLINPDPSTTRVTRQKGLPQGCGNLAVVARTPGTSKGFSVNFKEPYGLFECTFPRKFGVIDNAPRCINPLRASNSKTEVRTREMHPDLIIKILTTFCSPIGTVLDVFAGAITTALSCVAIKRPCVVLEKNAYCFDLAIKRLEKVCRDVLLEPEE